jgi:cell division protease FtsH
MDRLAAMLGGRAAEKLVTGEVSSGAQADLEHAASLARRMVSDFGMSKRLGPYIVKPFTPGFQGEWGVGYSERIAAEIDAEVQEILKTAEARASEAITTNRALLDKVAQTVMEVESLEGDALEQLLLEIKSMPAAEPARATAGS